MSYDRAWKYLEAAGPAGQGDRNNNLNRISYALLERFPDLSQSDHLELMHRWGSNCSPSLSESEVAKTASSAWHGAQRNGAVGLKQKSMPSRPASSPRIASSRPIAPPPKQDDQKLPAKAYDLETFDESLPPAMTDGTVQLLKAAFKAGEKVRIVPATLADDGGEVLPVTNCKDFGMIELWDDRAVQVVFNTGIRADGKEAKLWTSGAAVMWG